MKSEDEIRAELKKVEADERLSYPCATIQVNAPLALIQLGLETKRDTLKWILGDHPFNKEQP
jgi:hypothetical protein